MKKILFILMILVVVVGLNIFFTNNVEAVCRDCTGDPVCEIINPAFPLAPPTYNCTPPSVCGVECTQCGCVIPPVPVPVPVPPPPVPPPAPGGYDTSDLTPIVQCGGYLEDGVTKQPACTLCDLLEMVSRIMRLILILGFVFLVIKGIIKIIENESGFNSGGTFY